MNKKNILFLADTTHPAQAVSDHIHAIIGTDPYVWHVVNPLQCKVIDTMDFSMFDAIGVHYSIKPYTDYYLSARLKKKIALYLGTKFIFLQDEYQKVNQVQDFLSELGFHLLFTLVAEDRVDQAYPDPRLKHLKKVTVLTGYVQDNMMHLDAPKIADRPIDVSYRGRTCEYWLGSLAHDKELIALAFTKHCQGSTLKLDISIDESDRLYGNKWIEFLMHSKAVLGTESGASIWDFTDEIRCKTNQFLSQHKQANFRTVYDAVLKEHDGNLMYNAISPRVFEAAATKTPMILFPGEYNGICIADRHYIKLEKDFSNIDDVLKKLTDIEFLQALADRAHHDLIASGAYAQSQLSSVVEQELSILLNKPAQQSTAFCQSQVSKLADHSLLNAWRVIKIESTFIFSNFITMLFDRKYTLGYKCQVLLQGIKRYWAYLTPRLKS